MVSSLFCPPFLCDPFSLIQRLEYIQSCNNRMTLQILRFPDSLIILVFITAFISASSLCRIAVSALFSNLADQLNVTLDCKTESSGGNFAFRPAFVASIRSRASEKLSIIGFIGWSHGCNGNGMDALAKAIGGREFMSLAFKRNCNWVVGAHWFSGTFGFVAPPSCSTGGAGQCSRFISDHVVVPLIKKNQRIWAFVACVA